MRILKLNYFLVLSVMALGVAPFIQVEGAPVDSPDKRHYALTKVSLWRTFVPAMPGSGSGDSPGKMTIYASSGKSCGTHDVEMTSNINDLRWSSDNAYVPGGATWDLSECRN
jgi:hypothetical protein